jgi:hypothetical protein
MTFGGEIKRMEITPYPCTGISKIILVKGGHGFSKYLCQSFFECQNLLNNLIFYFFPHFAVMPKELLCMPYKLYWYVSRNCCVTDKKVLVGQSFVPNKSSHEIS